MSSLAVHTQKRQKFVTAVVIRTVMQEVFTLFCMLLDWRIVDLLMQPLCNLIHCGIDFLPDISKDRRSVRHLHKYRFAVTLSHLSSIINETFLFF